MVGQKHRTHARMGRNLVTHYCAQYLQYAYARSRPTALILLITHYPLLITHYPLPITHYSLPFLGLRNLRE